MPRTPLAVLALLPAVQFLSPLAAQAPTFTAAAVERLAWRNVGPANPQGRMTDVAVHPDRQSRWLVGTAGGGVWCTDNAGTTWRNVFDRMGTVSIGDVAIAPSDPEVIWIGTGEENARNSVQWGDGVYKSIDGGASWTHMGLFETFQIGHIEIHPTNPDVVYVAALGRLWSDNPERGVFRTRDGGRTWHRVLHLDDKTGCIDVRLHPSNPDIVLACMYERRRDRFDGNDPITRFGEHSGIYRSIDGGDAWQRVTDGLPSCTWGRSGLDVLAANPDTMFAIVETERSGWQKGDRKDRIDSDPPDDDQPQGQEGQPRRLGRGTALMGVGSEGDDGDESSPGAVLTQITEDGAAQKAGLAVGDRVTKIDDAEIKTYAELLELVRASRGEQVVQVTFTRGDESKTVELTYGVREATGQQAGGRPNGPYSGRLFGQEANKQKFQGELGHETGGVFRSDDAGLTWRRLNSLTERPFYYSVIRVDPQSADHLYCVGTSLWASHDGGEKFTSINSGIHVDFHAIWVDPDEPGHLLALCDGGVNESFDQGKTWQTHHGFSAAQYYDAVADNSVPYNIIGGLQDNGTWVVPSRTRFRDGITEADCETIWGGDGFGAQTDPVEPWIVYATSQNGAMGFLDLRTMAQARVARDDLPDGERPKFNWDAPFLLSPHNRLTVYHAGNHLFRGERYAHLDSSNSREGQGAVNNQRGLQMRSISPKLGRTDDGTAVSLAESPRVQGLLYVGTDDGALWRSDDGGANWQQLEQNLPVFEPLYVSEIVPSLFADDRVYVLLDGHRSDDLHTYVFVSEDRGKTFRDLGATLPGREPCYALAEDPRHDQLLYLGTEYGCWVSFDRGGEWLTLGTGLPTVSVRDLFVQDRDSDLIAATHGRGVFVLDIEGVRQLTADVGKRSVHLCAVEPAYLWRMQSRGFQGDRHYKAANPPYGATFHLWLKEAPAEAPVVTVHDVAQKEIARLEAKAQAGLQVLQWDARAGRSLAAPGTYSVRVSCKGAAEDDTTVRAFELRPDPGLGGDADASTSSTNHPSTSSR